MFLGSVGVPPEAGTGKVKITFSFPDWRDAHVQPTSFEVNVVDPGPEKPRTLSDGHDGFMYSLAISGDNRLLASCGGTMRAPGEVRLWDLTTGKQVRAFYGHYGTVFALTLTHNGKLLATAGEDKTARLWDIDTGKMLRQFVGHSHEVWAVAFSPDDKVLATGDRAAFVRLWDVASGAELAVVAPAKTENELGVHRLVFTPDGKELIVASGGQNAGQKYRCGTWRHESSVFLSQYQCMLSLARRLARMGKR